MTTAIAHPNIALVKYWGKRDAALNLPAAGSLSLTLEGLSTTTRVDFDEALADDVVTLDGVELDDAARSRISNFLDLVRTRAGIRTRARVVTTNDFPTAAGLASSASGFAALALAASRAAGLSLSATELSILARRGSGSAARSIFGGFVEMRAGAEADGSDAYAVSVAESEHWDLHCLVAVTSRGAKKIGSTRGMNQTTRTSPYYGPWIESVAPDVAEAKEAIAARDFDHLARVAERSCLRMHASALGADPGILYFNGVTVELIHRIRTAREQGVPVFFSIDAGPHVKAFCPAHAREDVERLLRYTPGVLDILFARPGAGARVVDGEGA